MTTERIHRPKVYHPGSQNMHFPNKTHGDMTVLFCMHCEVVISILLLIDIFMHIGSLFSRCHCQSLPKMQITRGVGD